MACFLVPVAEAAVTTAAIKMLQAKEKTNVAGKPSETVKSANGLPFSHKLKWLSNLLWGGSALLAFEHVWHGEVTPWFPFLTAAGSPAETAQMLHEMGTAGVAMSVLVTAVWTGMVLITAHAERSGYSKTVSEH
ncbi:MAG: hypothetical protein ACI3XY_05105 [Butyricicoccaceae bacterium]